MRWGQSHEEWICEGKRSGKGGRAGAVRELVHQGKEDFEMELFGDKTIRKKKVERTRLSGN